MGFSRQVTQFRFTQAYIHKLVDDLSDEQFVTQPSPGMNPPIWLIGHLTIAADYGLAILGKPKLCSEAWHRDFGPGSTPLKPVEPYPSKAAMMTAFDAAHDALISAAEQADESKLAEKHTLPMKFIQRALPTVGDLIAHLMSTHEAVHVGQLSAWRRMMGLSAVPF